MKKNQKTFKSLIVMLVVFILAGMIPYSVSADVINYYMYTDIIATIDGYEIKTFNIDGYTNVVAEDLRNYGFDVKWDPLRRRLDISRSVYPTAPVYYTAPRVSWDMVGKKAGDVLRTDIKTYVEGKYIDSYNIGGLTCVNIETVAKRLNCQNVYNNYERRLYITRPTYPNFYATQGVKWTTNISRYARYRDLDIKVLSADMSNVTFQYKLYYEYSDKIASSGTLTVPYHPENFKYLYDDVNSYTTGEIFKLGLVTDMFVIPDEDGREFDKIRLIFGEDGMMYQTPSSTSLTLSSFYECERK